MLNLVPLARPRRVVTDRDRHRDLIGERLQAKLPGAQLGTVAAAAVGADQESPRGSVEAPAVQSPPATNTLDRKLGGIVADADVHHGPVPRNVVGAVGHGLAPAEMREIVHVDLDRIAVWPPRLTRIAEFSYQFLLLRIDRDDRVAGLDVALHQSVDVPELLVARRRLRALFGFDVRLQRVPEIMQTAAHGARVNLVAATRHLLGDRPRRFARPPQEAHRVTGRGLFDDPGNQGRDLRRRLFDALATRAGAANPAQGGGPQGAT